MDIDNNNSKMINKPYKISLYYKSSTSKDKGIEQAETKNLVTLKIKKSCIFKDDGELDEGDEVPTTK